MISRNAFSRLSLFERFLSIFTSVRPGEGAAVRHLFSCAFLLTFAYYLLKPVREALLLSEGDAELGAYMDGVVAVTLIFLIPLYKQLYLNLQDSALKSAILRWVIAFFISNLLVFVLMGAAGLSVSIPFYAWLSIFNVMVVAQFWAFAADLFNTKSGQRLFVVIMVGSSIGAWAGAKSAEALSLWVSPHLMMLGAAVLLAAPLFMSYRAEHLVPEGSENHEPLKHRSFGGFSELFGGFDVVFRSHYLAMLALFMLLLNLISSLGKYLLRGMVKARSDALAASPELGVDASEYILAFYGDYNAWIALISLLLQLFVVSRLFRYVGVRGTILILPCFMLLQFGALALIPVFGLVRATMIGQNAINYSVQNTANQALYLPLSREEKYVGKTTVDTVFVRLGDLAQGLLVFAIVGWLGLGQSVVIGVTLVLAALFLAVANDIRHSHRRLVRAKLSNVPPRVVKPLPNVYAPSGRLLMFSIPDDCFFDPDPGDTLEYQARLADGSALPGWIRFDRGNQTFTVKPPAGEEGCVVVELQASDFDGHTAEGTFELKFGLDPVHRFESAAAPASS